MSSKFKKKIEDLAEIVRQHPDGISIEELLHFTDEIIPKRTVQYRLSILIKSGIYHFNQVAENRQTVKLAEAVEVPSIVPLSLEGEKRYAKKYRFQFNSAHM